VPDYSDHSEVLTALKESQEADSDNRDAAREAHLFIDKRDGQWEPYWWNASRGRPRYTFDMTGPIVDEIAGEMEQADFDITIRPGGGDTTKDDAQLFDGLIRNIESMSNAVDVFNLAGRSMITAGIDGWQIKQKFVDDDSFEQDLVIEHIANFVDSEGTAECRVDLVSDTRRVVYRCCIHSAVLRWWFSSWGFGTRLLCPVVAESVRGRRVASQPTLPVESQPVRYHYTPLAGRAPRPGGIARLPAAGYG